MCRGNREASIPGEEDPIVSPQSRASHSEHAFPTFSDAYRERWLSAVDAFVRDTSPEEAQTTGGGP